MTGLLDHLVEASHISAGIGCTFAEALEIVKAAHEPIATLDEPTKPTTIGNVVFGVNFISKKPKHATHCVRGTL